MSRAEIICHHCGIDYSREYWLMGPASDPNVCKGCRRDTNPDAADAPRGGPPVPVPDDDPPYVAVITRGQKWCRRCGSSYDGLIFGSSVSKGSLPLYGICPPCELAEDRAAALATAPTVPYTVAVRE